MLGAMLSKTLLTSPPSPWTSSCPWKFPRQFVRHNKETRKAARSQSECFAFHLSQLFIHFTFVLAGNRGALVVSCDFFIRSGQTHVVILGTNRNETSKRIPWYPGKKITMQAGKFWVACLGFLVGLLVHLAASPKTLKYRP